ncbi:MAG: glycosyltransferase family 4 protein [Victivallaceae bacterium]|nr:glycosyltransferase family 4 protein [Victivallaceae bacterium]
MKILFITHYYSPEGNAPASRVSALAERWAAAGHDVTVLTGVPNVPDGIVYPGYKNRRKQIENLRGVNVVRVWTFIAPNRGTVKRSINYLSFMFSAFFCGLFMGKPDVMIATSPQFFCGWAGVLLHVFRHIPFVLEIRDIWPESMSAVGAKLPKFFLKMIGILEKKMYKSADSIVTVGPGYILKLKERGVPEEKISVVMNGVDKRSFFPRPKNERLLAENRLTGKFICSYIGTIGMACGLQTALDAGAILKERRRDDIRIVLVGDGASREALQKEAAERNLDNVIFTGRRPKEEMPDWIASSDVNLVHLKKTDLFTTVMPSKIFESAGCARPILMGVDGFAKQLVMDAEAGVPIEPENAGQLADALEKLADDPALCAALGKNAFNNIASKYDRDIQSKDYLAILERVKK